MPFLLLLVLTLICLQRDWPEPAWWGAPGSIALTWLGVTLFVAAAYVFAKSLEHRLSHQPDERHRLLRRYATLRRRHGFALLAFYLLAIYLLGWGWSVKNLLADPLPGAELLTLSPFLAGLVLCW